MNKTSKAKRSTVNGVEQTYRCTRSDGTSYEVPSYFPARGVSVADAAKALGLRFCGRTEGLKLELAGTVVAEIHDCGLSNLMVQA